MVSPSAATPTFDAEVNTLLAWVQNEMARGRLTGVQADFLNRRAVALEAAHAASIKTLEEL